MTPWDEPPADRPPERARAVAVRLSEAVAVVVLFALTQLALSFFTVGIVRLFGLAEHAAARELVLRVALPTALLGSQAVGWWAAWYVVRRRHGLPFPAALGLPLPLPRGLPRVFFGGMLLQVAVLLIVVLLPPPPDLVSPLERLLRQGAWAMWLVLVVAVVIAPFVEEVLFRGLLLGALRRHWPFPLAALAVTVVFTALHASQTRTYWPALAGIFLCGWVLAGLRERSGSLWPPVALHMGFNAMAFLPLLLASSLR